MRDSGINLLGKISWGTHFCHFYKTKEDLLNILVPYFKAGLENNECCLWITSAPLSVRGAKAALKRKVKNLDSYVEKGQIEILGSGTWFLKSGEFEIDQVLEAWAQKEIIALSSGYDGLRCSGNTSWVGKKHWKDFAEYEARIHSTNGRYRMIALCSYPLLNCKTSRFFDIVNSHKLALFKRKNKWTLIESSESKRADTVMRESEERWRFMVQNTPDIIITVAPDGKILASNRAMLNITTEEVIGKKIYDYAAPEYCRTVKASIERALATGKPKNCVFFGTGPDGPKTAWYETLIVPIKHNGDSMAATLVLRDITKTKQAEAAFLEVDEKLRTILENVNDIIFQLSPEGIITYVSPRIKELSGYTPEELVGQHLKRTTPKSEIQRVLRILKKVLNGETIKHFEIEQINRTGKHIPMEINLCPVKKAGKIVAVQGTMRDISERKEAEKNLHIERTHLDNLFNNGMVAIVMANKEGRVLRVNNAFNKLFGYEMNEVIGKHLDSLVASNTCYNDAVAITGKVAKGERVSFEAVRQRKDGTPINVTVYASPIVVDGELTAVYGIYQENNGRSHQIPLLCSEDRNLQE